MDDPTRDGLTTAEANQRLARDGPNEVREQPEHPVRRFVAKFWGLSAWMLELIAILSFVLHKAADAWVAVALLLVNAVVSHLQEQRASTAVAALRRRMQVTARVLRDGAWMQLAASRLVRDDVVRMRAGDFVPADVKLAQGELRVDQSGLTGESLPVDKHGGDPVYAGSVIQQGEATGTVTATGATTYFGRTTQLVDSAKPKLHVEAVVSRVVRWLFVIVGAQVAVLLVVALAGRMPLLELLPLSLVLLMSAVPVALPVMFTVSMALGSVELAKKGVLVTRLNAAEDAANLDVLCADKTGTLTMNRLAWVDALPQPGFREDDVLRDGALASSAANQDPIDLAFLRAAQERGAVDERMRQRSFTPFAAQTRRTEAVVEIAGRDVRVAKGALRTIGPACGIDEPALAAIEGTAAAATGKGYRILAVARAEGDGALTLVGLAVLADTLRPDSKELVAQLRGLGIGVRMITGDALPVAREIARELDIADVSAEVFPEKKFSIVRDLQGAGHVVGMTGDGVNDAPALRQAEVGIAVSGATDVAKGAASVVLTREGLTGIVDLVGIGRSIYQRVLTWIVNKVSRTILKSGFVVAAFLATGQFVISALGMVLLVFMTDFVKIALSTDRVCPSQRPESWNIQPLVKVAVWIGLLMLAEALGLLALAWQPLALATDAGRRHSFAFATLLFFALFSIVSIRERRAFWASRPSTPLAVALALDGVIGAAIVHFGFGDFAALGAAQIAAIVGYALACALLVNDRVKVALLARSGAV